MHEDKGGFCDFGTEIPPGPRDPRVVISHTAFLKMAELWGYPTREEHALVLAERDAIQKELEDVQAELRECNRELDAIATLRGRGYQPEKRRGRPPLKAA